MSVEWFRSDSQSTRAEEWHRVIVTTNNASRVAIALEILSHQFRIGVRVGDAAPAVWYHGNTSVEIVGKAFRAFPASELENWLRTRTGDAALQVRIGYITGFESVGYTGRGFAMGAIHDTSRLLDATGTAASSVAQGAASLATGIGATAQTAGEALPWLTILAAIGAIILAIIAIFTAPRWVPALLSG